jgi:aryl-alcohol dehydrogenase-like predicted oxidoreductase
VGGRLGADSGYLGGMDHVHLGTTGLLVSKLCLGTMTMGLQSDEATSVSVLDRAAEGGITFIDTADVYPLGGGLPTVGRTEEVVGRWLQGKRDRFVLATKCAGRTGPAAWEQGNSRKHILDAVEDSLRRLATDYIDLYQLHSPDPGTPIDETLSAVDDLVRSGKVRYVGCSNFLAYQVAQALGRSQARSLVRFDSVQPRYNLLFRQIERELLPLCAEEGLGVIPYNPIAGGLLSGKHSPSAPPEDGTRFTIGNAGAMYQKRYWHDREFASVEELRKVAEREGVSLVTLSVAWVLANPAVTSPIIGASRPEQLDDSLAATDFVMSGELKAELDEITHEYRMGDAAR